MKIKLHLLVLLAGCSRIYVVETSAKQFNGNVRHVTTGQNDGFSWTASQLIEKLWSDMWDVSTNGDTLPTLQVNKK